MAAKGRPVRNLAAVIVLLVAAHLLLLSGGFVWLAASDRLSADRAGAVVDVFRVPVSVQAVRDAEAEAAAADARAIQEELQRMEEVADGPKDLGNRLMEKLLHDDLAVHRLERLQEEGAAVRTRLAQDRAYVEEALARLDRERAAFEAAVAKQQDKMADQDFLRAVETLEQLKAAQAKDVVRELVATGGFDQAVDYLAAMDLRKSAGILKQFKGEQEAAEAAVLIEAIRTRQSRRLEDAIRAASPTPAPLASADLRAPTNP